MKVNKVSEHIWSLKLWMIIPIHVWFVVDREGVTLVDAGISSMAKPIMQLINKLEAGPLQRILLTHGHSDHVGALNKILSDTKVLVYAHQKEIPYLEGERPYPRRKKAKQVLAKGCTQALKEGEQGQLHSIAGLTPYLTPGHSPGHVVYYHEQDQVLLAGDLFTSKKGKLKQPIPMFTANMDEAVKSSAIVGKLKPKQLEVCHGKTVYHPADQLKDYVDQMNNT
ncbi:MBL fold metallo-hydrolase [Amphibacillus sp. Q70]|uniref:MBL fold metallo-hydrolase n=1 Tax=Amphibacillus sp. Q70 TaxID=3453416 RepID=UPI003F82F2E8